MHGSRMFLVFGPKKVFFLLFWVLQSNAKISLNLPLAFEASEHFMASTRGQGEHFNTFSPLKRKKKSLNEGK